MATNRQVLALDDSALLRLIEREQLEISYEESETGKYTTVCVFPFKNGGAWAEARTLRKAIAKVVVYNDLSLEEDQS